jgi:hypothetical protein
VVGSIPVTDGALSILRAGLWHVKESFAGSAERQQ